MQCKLIYSFLRPPEENPQLDLKLTGCIFALNAVKGSVRLRVAKEYIMVDPISARPGNGISLLNLGACDDVIIKSLLSLVTEEHQWL